MERQLAERLKSKSVKNAIIGRTAEDFNLTPLLAEAYFNQIKDYFLHRPFAYFRSDPLPCH